MTQKVFAVFQIGVYRHECGGIFFTQAEAEGAAEALIRGECDDYHTYGVIPFVAGEITHQIRATKYERCLVEPEAVVVFSRAGGNVIRQEPHHD